MASFLFILIAALCLPGIINRTRAVLSGRKGIRFFQHLRNVRVLLGKGSVYSTTTGFVFRAAPVVYLAAILTAILFVPLGGYGAIFSFDGDLVVFAYLLGLSRLAILLGALDTGSSFEGMGAAREALYGALVEPALFFVFGTLALMTGQTGFSSVFKALSASSPEMIIVTLLLSYVLVKIIIVESGRIPVDDPRTHLELTMVHEVMILDYSGVDLAMIHLASWIKTAALATVGAGIIASTTRYAGASALLIFIFVALIGIVIGTLESFRARNKLSKNPTYIVTTVSLALFAFLLVYIVSLNLHIE